jgi:DeoR family transcriptional regulator, suf operon transcriptional repressor
MQPVVVGDSAYQVLSHLLKHKGGSTVEELATALGITRTAVNQHLTALAREGYVARGDFRKTTGRPVRLHVLTENGYNLFPKKYSWFSKVLISTMQEQMGADKLDGFMFDLGVKLSADMIPRLVGKDRSERVAETVRIMNETGFQAATIPSAPGDRHPRVECRNCVYHDLAKEYPSVCRFDIGFLSGLVGAEVEHESCMLRGGTACRFRFRPPT